MNIFYALGEPTRLSIVELLAMQGRLTATQIASKFSVSAAAISQHLKVLREAKLVIMEKNAQQRIYQIDKKTIHEVENWSKELTKTLDKRFSIMERLLDDIKKKG
ncbi:MAG: metalloregulator ArsR/SmtB family transcription factor [Candidatus Dojkabacteria bacterium]